MRTSLAAIVLASFAWAPPLEAHRLDEYLQAARVSVEANRARVELDLSPGVAVAGGIVGTIDSNHDGQVDVREADAYAAAVLREATLNVDGRAVTWHLEHCEIAAIDDMLQGVGTTRIVASAPVTAASGHHRLTLTNNHQPRVSVYLANALTPTDRRVTLGAQRRDVLQRTFTLDYDVAGTRAWLGWSGAAVSMVTFLLVGRRRSRGSV